MGAMKRTGGESSSTTLTSDTSANSLSSTSLLMSIRSINASGGVLASIALIIASLVSSTASMSSSNSESEPELDPELESESEGLGERWRALRAILAGERDR